MDLWGCWYSSVEASGQRLPGGASLAAASKIGWQRLRQCLCQHFFRDPGSRKKCKHVQVRTSPCLDASPTIPQWSRARQLIGGL